MKLYFVCIYYCFYLAVFTSSRFSETILFQIQVFCIIDFLNFNKVLFL